MMPMTKTRTKEEEDQLIRDFLMPKPAPIPPSSFDINESTSPTALAGKMDVPPIDDFLNYKLTLDDIPGYTPPPEEPMAPPPAAPVAPMVKKPAPMPPKPEPVPSSVDALTPAPAIPAGPSDREKLMEGLKGDDWASVIGKALSAMGDAQLAKAGGKGNFLNNAITMDTEGRERKIKEFDTAAAKKKEDTEYAAKNDPTSPRSKAYQDLMTEYFPGKDFSKMSANQIEEVIGPVSKMADSREARKTREATLAAQRESLKSERDRRYDERRQKEKTDIIDKFNRSSGVVKIEASLDAANTIRGLVDSNNPIAASAVPTFMARASGEVGNLSEADKRPFGGSQALLSRLEAAITQKANGRLTRENAAFIKNLADTMEKRAVSNKDRRAREWSLQYGKANDFLDPNDLYDTLRPDARRASGGKVTVTNGSETLMIDPTDVEDAKKDGYRVVG